MVKNITVKNKKRKKIEIFDIINTFFILLICIITIYPILYVFGRSIMSDVERALRPFAIFPKKIDLSAYKYILGKGSLIYNGYAITLFRTIVGTALSLIVEAMFAYVISKKKYPLRNALTIMIAFTMWFQGGLIPTFLLVRSLHLMNSIWVYIFPTLMSAWNILIMRNFFAQIPEGLEESAKIDGANEAVVFFKIVLPLSKPVLATIGLFHAVTHWNEWFSALIYVNDNTKWPVQVILRQILATAMQSEIMEDNVVATPPPAVSVQMATVVIVTVPILLVYPFIQKYFTKGMLVGSIKG
ncbi:carbohydrate ABC transporter permease [Defluviitalea phaphyphila]|uniref:carbohydrate ABC transporter permease n=1 Tax=Defluviitalea phaphyphila TaxID=1473580 RepID=UPI00073072C8|nr:carbohydrate ABC transporter permease [Defluviitalea phaphyphila]